jgi:ABC-type Zn uptake system ZnuABC Zn-binding protein ZnuA
MTNREFYNLIAADTTLTDEIRAHAEEQIAKLDAIAEKRKGKVSKADMEKRVANEAAANHIAETILTSEAKTATDVAAILTAETGEEVKVQKASYLLRLAVEMGLANVTEVKIPKKGTQKAYTIAG